MSGNRQDRPSHCGWVTDADLPTSRSEEKVGAPLVGSLKERQMSRFMPRLLKDRENDRT